MNCFLTLVFALIPSIFAISDPPVELFRSVPYGTPFNGVVRAGGCAGALIQTWSLQPVSNSPAYVLTAGHCFGDYLGADKGAVIFDDTRFMGSFIYTNDFYNSPPNVYERFPINMVRFSTMNLTDIAIIQLDVTAQSLVDRGYTFYQVSNLLPVQNNVHNQVGYPAGFSMTSTDALVGVRVAFVESWGHEIEMAYSFDGGVYPGFSGSPNFLGTTITAVTTHRSGPVNGFSQRVDYVNACFNNGLFNFELRDCFYDYKVRFLERFGVYLPGLLNPDDPSPPPPPPPRKEFGDDIDEIIDEPIDTTPPEEAPLPPPFNSAMVFSRNWYSPLLSFFLAFVFFLCFD